MSNIVISIAKQFSPTPGGRYASDGPFPGEKFREELLLPELKKPDNIVIVDLEGTAGFGSSFLEEAFGGLVRRGLTVADLKSRLKIKSDRPSYSSRIWSYIEGAMPS